jgi:hypothetical protein
MTWWSDEEGSRDLIVVRYPLQNGSGARNGSVVRPPTTSTAGGISMLWMHHAQMASKGIIPAESLLLGTVWAVDLLLSRIVDCILMTGQIVRPRENRVAGLPR